MEHARRPAWVSRLGPALGVLAGLLALLWWVLAEGAGAPVAAGEQDLDPRQAAAAAAAPRPGDPAGGIAEKETPEPARRAVADAPDPAAMRLRVEVVDPLDLLARGHQLVASGEGSLVCRRWRREGQWLLGEWADETAPPRALDYFFEPLRPAQLLVTRVPFAEDPEGGWRARLDLTETMALVELAVVGGYAREVACSLQADFSYGYTSGILDQIEKVGDEPVTVAVPVPSMITVALHDGVGTPQAAQQSIFPIRRGGRHRYEIPAASGSVRVRIHEPAGRTAGKPETFHLELWPDLARGGQRVKRILSADTGSDAEFTMVPPGRYELYCWAEQDRRRLIGGRTFEVGPGETFIEFRGPQEDRTLLVRGAPPGSEVWLLRPGVSHDAARGGLAGEDGTARIEGLDAAEWIVWARGTEGVALASADTRFTHDAEAMLGEFLPLVEVEVEVAAFPPGGAEIFLIESGGRRVTAWLSVPMHEGPQKRRFSAPIRPGLLRVRALHQSGLVADAEALVPALAPGADPFRVPLNFREP